MDNLQEKIQLAWGYDEWFKEEYGTFDDFYEDFYYLAPHEEGRDRYASAAGRLEKLVKEVHEENN